MTLQTCECSTEKMKEGRRLEGITGDPLYLGAALIARMHDTQINHAYILSYKSQLLLPSPPAYSIKCIYRAYRPLTTTELYEPPE
jgi:hypothetical protein